MSAHKDISIPFTIKNGEEERRYKALGFLVVDEEELPFDEMNEFIFDWWTFTK